jgi:hypothetical protein
MENNRFYGVKLEWNICNHNYIIFFRHKEEALYWLRSKNIDINNVDEIIKVDKNYLLNNNIIHELYLLGKYNDIYLSLVEINFGENILYFENDK